MNLVNQMKYSYEIMTDKNNSPSCRKHFKREYGIYKEHILNGGSKYD